MASVRSPDRGPLKESNAGPSSQTDYFALLLNVIGEISQDDAKLRKLVYAMIWHKLRADTIISQSILEPSSEARSLVELESALELERAIARVEHHFSHRQHQQIPTNPNPQPDIPPMPDLHWSEGAQKEQSPDRRGKENDPLPSDNPKATPYRNDSIAADSPKLSHADPNKREVRSAPRDATNSCNVIERATLPGWFTFETQSSEKKYTMQKSIAQPHIRAPKYRSVRQFITLVGIGAALYIALQILNLWGG